MNRTSPSHARLTLTAFLLLVVGVPAAVSAGSITLAWDPSPSPGVIGYRVYVGTEPGAYSQTYDVGLATSFVYQASDTRQYYLAVAAYTAGPTVGPLSAPVSGSPRENSTSSSTDARSFYESLWRSNPPAPSSLTRDVMPPVALTACWTPSDCLIAQTLVRRTSPIASVAAAPDGRIFFIEGDRQIRVVESNVLQSEPVLSAESPTLVLTQVILDPQFHVTGIFYVGETETLPDGQAEFRVARYRVRGNQAEERSVVAAVPLVSSGQALFTVASSGHIFVAIPQTSTGDEWYSGKVLLFNPDGSGTAIVATGYSTPTAMTFDEATQRMWVAGVDENNQPSLSGLAGDYSPSAVALPPPTSSHLMAPVQSLATAAHPSTSWLFAASTAGAFARARVDVNGAISDSTQLTLASGLVQAVTTTPGGDLLVVVWSQPSATSTYSIVRLTPAP